VTVKHARTLRKNQTRAENIFWREVRNRLFLNLKFRRQVPIGKYIVDFVCEQEKLIIELDGDQHAENEEYDEERTECWKITATASSGTGTKICMKA